MWTAFIITESGAVVFDGDIQEFADNFGCMFSTPNITVKNVKAWCSVNGFSFTQYGNV